jgi:lipopolysaccharide/colanic/teichoic acid biosynthesis glycosyltransferase
VDPEGPVDYPAAKRLLDKVVSVLLLLLLSPLLAVVLAAMALDALFIPADRGGFVYREARITRGREFGLLKFRTLRRAAVQTQAGGEAHARLLEADSQNLTWAGRRILKPWYLDEIPQLLNVLRGDMSLVGPRPWPPSLVEQQVASGLDYRTRVTAGWTGPAQVRKDLTAPESYAELDLEYVTACHTWGTGRLVRYDLSLLWQTVKLLARGEGLRF